VSAGAIGLEQGDTYEPEARVTSLLAAVETSPSVSVIVPTTELGHTLPRCLAAIEAACSNGDEVIVVDDTLKAGPGNARNEGAVKAANGILVFVDCDVEIRRDALDLIRARFTADPKLAAVFGSYDDDPHERDVISSFRNLLHHYVHQRAAGDVDSFWAGLGAVRTDVFEEAGGFDTRITRASVEDVELGARLRRIGRIELAPEIQGKHLKRWSLAGMLGTDLRHRGIPWTRLALCRRATRQGLNLAWPHRLSALSTVLMLVSVGCRRPRSAAAWLVIIYAINQRFYRLLARRGRRHWFAGLGLHLIHHLVCVLSLLLGAAAGPDHGEVRGGVERRLR
jgi:glycosyltransferase involved in cell wall biosynthesis